MPKKWPQINMNLELDLNMPGSGIWMDLDFIST